MTTCELWRTRLAWLNVSSEVDRQPKLAHNYKNTVPSLRRSKKTPLRPNDLFSPRSSWNNRGRHCLHLYHIAFTTNIKNSKQHTTLRIATGWTPDTNIKYLHNETMTIPLHTPKAFTNHTKTTPHIWNFKYYESDKKHPTYPHHARWSGCVGTICFTLFL